jgi:hypothetical protein
MHKSKVQVNGTWMREAAKFATLLVLLHLAVLLGHGTAHAHLGIGTNRWQSGFIAVVIFICPLVGMALIWAGRRAGVTLLGFSFAGSLIFGVYYHFILAGSDNVLSTDHTGWGLCFRATAVALALIELLGSAWSGRTRLRLSQQYQARDENFAGA